MNISRITILDILGQNPHGLKVEQIYLEAQKHHEISLASVYRLLAEMEHKGLVKRSFMRHKKATYQLADSKITCNLVDVKTGKAEIYTDQVIMEQLENIIAHLDKDFIGLEVTLYKI